MINQSLETVVKRIVFVGAPAVTLFILTGSVTDPVNATKLFLAGGMGISSLFLFMAFGFKRSWVDHRAFLISLTLFNVFSLYSISMSKSPFSQNFYGAFGRNTGFLCYLFLSCIALAPLMFRDVNSFSYIIRGLQIAGVANVIYCGWVLLFGDFVSWSNPYGNILGFFGNPDFISAFLGIFVTACLALILEKNLSLPWRLAWILISLMALFEIKKSHAVQGLVVCAGGVAIVGFFWIRSLTKSKILNFSYLIATSTLGVLAILGAFQKGPFSFVYKTSVSLRGSYWHAGLKMGFDHPLSGVGMDAFGDWYRRARSIHAATVLPGPGTVSNAAHNVLIDIFAYGGWPLFLSYILLLILPAISIFKVLRNSRDYNAIFVAMTGAWACYQVQSIISINQVGLALWGWLLAGALIAYERSTLQKTESKQREQSVRRSSTTTYSPQLVAGLGLVVGLLIAVPPLSADSKWRSALESKDANRLIEALKPGYLNPSDSQRYAQAVQIFAQSNLMDQAHSIAMSALEYNPDSYDGWRVLYFLPTATAEEKSKALTNMERLDPLNPDVTKP